MGRQFECKDLKKVAEKFTELGIPHEVGETTKTYSKDNCTCYYDPETWQGYCTCQCDRWEETVTHKWVHIDVEWARKEWGVEPYEENYLTIFKERGARNMPGQLENILMTIPGCSISGFSDIDSWECPLRPILQTA
jgi:hypothetical protein